MKDWKTVMCGLVVVLSLLAAGCQQSSKIEEKPLEEAAEIQRPANPLHYATFGN